MTFRELIYMVLDRLKATSDDSYYTEDHIKSLLNTYRSKLIQDAYSSIKKEIPQSYYQCITLPLEYTTSVAGAPCVGGRYLRSINKVPKWLPVASPIIYPVDVLTGLNMTKVPITRFRFIGDNKWFNNIIYFSLGPDNILYCKSNNPQFKYLEKISIYAVFEDTEEAEKLSCCSCEDTKCSPLDKPFPIEEALIPTLLDIVISALNSSVYRPIDDNNDSTDDLPNAARHQASQVN